MSKAQGTIARNTVFDSVAQGLAMGFSILIGIVLANVLEAEGRGQFILATSFAGMLLLSFTNFGLELASRVLMAKDTTRLPQIHTLVVLACLVIGGVVTTGLLLGIDLIQTYLLPEIRRSDLIALGVALPFWVYQYGCFGMLVGLGKIRTRALFELGLSFLQNATVLGILLLGAGEAEEMVRVLVIVFYALLVAGSLVLPFLLGGPLWALPGWSLVREFYQYGFWVYVANLGDALSQKVDQYFVQQISTGTGAFGVYTLATGLTARTRIFPAALSRSAYPQICALPQPEAARLVAACFRQMLALGLLLCLGGAILSPLLPIIYSNQFAGAVIPFLIFLVGRLFHNCSWMLANYFSGHLARPQIATAVNWGLIPIQAVFAYFAMKLGGLVAVAAITAGSYIILFLAFLILFLKWQDTVRLKELFRLTGSDFAPWKRLLTKIVGR